MESEALTAKRRALRRSQTNQPRPFLPAYAPHAHHHRTPSTIEKFATLHTMRRIPCMRFSWFHSRRLPITKYPNNVKCQCRSTEPAYPLHPPPTCSWWQFTMPNQPPPDTSRPCLVSSFNQRRHRKHDCVIAAELRCDSPRAECMDSMSADVW